MSLKALPYFVVDCVFQRHFNVVGQSSYLDLVQNLCAAVIDYKMVHVDFKKVL
jgi:hypothetical protein